MKLKNLSTDELLEKKRKIDREMEKSNGEGPLPHLKKVQKAIREILDNLDNEANPTYELSSTPEKTQKLDLKIDWSSLDKEGVLKALEGYDEVAEPKPGSKVGELLIYQEDLLTESGEKLHFEVVKLPKKYKEAEDQLQINIVRPKFDEEDRRHYVADFDFARYDHETEEEWDMKHRRTGEIYRGQGIAGEILSLAENFLRQRAQQKEVNQKMSARVWQEELIYWLDKKDYKPATKEDKYKLKRIKEADKSLEIYTAPVIEGKDYERPTAIFDTKKFMENFAGKVTGPQDPSVWDPINYDKGFFYMKSAFSVKFEKNFPA